MESCRQKSYRINRPNCLELKYVILASRLIALQILTETKHTYIKSISQDNVDRMDELMGFLHEFGDSELAFDGFVAGIRDCGSPILADKVQLDCGDEVGISTNNMESTSENNLEETNITVSTSIFEVTNSSSQILFEETVPKSSNSPSSSMITSTCTNPHGEQNRIHGNVSPQSQHSQLPIGSPFASYCRHTPEKRIIMTFQQVITRQIYGTIDFYFSNPSVRVQTIHLNPNAGVTYKGCQVEVGIESSRICAKRVTELNENGNINYICQCGHKRNSFISIPRLKITFQDDTGVLPLTLFRQNVEIFLEMNAYDLNRLDSSELILKLENTKTKEWNLEDVVCEKRKHARFPWDNCVHIISQVQPLLIPCSDSDNEYNLEKRRKI